MPFSQTHLPSISVQPDAHGSSGGKSSGCAATVGCAMCATRLGSGDVGLELHAARTESTAVAITARHQGFICDFIGRSVIGELAIYCSRAA